MKKRIEKLIASYQLEIARLNKILKTENLGKLKKRDVNLMIDMFATSIEKLTEMKDIKPHWPDEVRLKMIEKSENYADPHLYQYGYYDGFLHGITY